MQSRVATAATPSTSWESPAHGIRSLLRIINLRLIKPAMKSLIPAIGFARSFNIDQGGGTLDFTANRLWMYLRSYIRRRNGVQARAGIITPAPAATTLNLFGPTSKPWVRFYNRCPHLHPWSTLGVEISILEASYAATAGNTSPATWSPV